MPTFINGLSVGLGQNGGTTTNIDMTGADFFILSVSWFREPFADPSDSGLNTWIPLTEYVEAADFKIRFWYCSPTVIQSNQTFTWVNANSYATIAVAGFSGMHLSSPWTSQESGNNGTSTGGFQAGSLTPSEDNCIVVGGLVENGATTSAPTADGGFTTLSTQYLTASYMGGGLAYLIQSGATAANPGWSWGGQSVSVAATLAVFKPATVGGYLLVKN